MSDNPEQMLEYVQYAIETRVRGKSKSFYIGWGPGGIVCWPVGIIEPEFLFGIFTDSELDQGLKKTQWDDLKLKIAEFLEKN